MSTDYLFVTDSQTETGVRARGGLDGICRALVALSDVGQNTQIVAYDSMLTKVPIFNYEIGGTDVSTHFLEFDVAPYPNAVLVISAGRRDKVIKIL